MIRGYLLSGNSTNIINRSRARYSTAFKSSPLPTLLCLADGRILEANRSAEKRFGPVALLADLVGDEPTASLLASAVSVAEGEVPLTFTTPSGVSFHGRVVMWAVGHEACLQFLDQDPAPLQALVDALPQAALVLDEQQRVACWNESLERLTGIGRDEVISTRDHWRAFYRKRRLTLADMVMSGDVDKVLDDYSSRDIRRSELSPETFEAEADYRSPDGSTRRLLFNASAIRNAEGRLVGAVETLLDISYHHRLEQALRQSEITYRRLVETLTEGVAVVGAEGHLLANRSYLDLFGFSSLDQLTDKTFTSLIHPESGRDFLSWSRSLALAPFEGLALTADGLPFQIEASVNPIVYADQDAFQITVRDVSPKKRAEEHLVQAERLEAAGRLAFEVVHEINNPLSAILTYARLLAADLPGKSPHQETIEKIIKQINRCRIVVGGLQDFARQDRRGNESVDINALVGDVMDILSGHRLLRNVELCRSLSSNLPTIRGQRLKLEQALLNVLVNAMEAMSGSGRLEVSTSLAGGGKRIEIQVIDSGRGIPQTDLQLIFEPFYTTKDRCRGTGLGLSISLGIIKRHGGDIKVDTDSRSGTRITISLPCAC